MRSVLSSLSLLLALVASTVTLVAYLVHETVLDTDDLGAVAAAALQDDELRRQLLTRALPEYGRLPAFYQERVERLAEGPQLRRALKQVDVDDQGRVALAPVRRQVLEDLRAEYPAVAAQLESVGGEARFRLPRRVLEPYQDARRISWLVATRGAVVALALLVVGVLLARRTRAGLLAAGLVLLLSSAAAVGVVLVLPALLELGVDLDGVEQRLLRAAVPDASTAFEPLLPVVVAGAAAAVIALMLPRRH
jgi:hypothetical protein